MTEEWCSLVGPDYEPLAAWDRLDGHLLESHLQSRAIALLDASWLIRLAATSSILDIRQKLSPEAFLTVDQVKNATCEGDQVGIHVIVLSYMWLHPQHPDPKGSTLQALAHMLQAWLSNGYPVWGVLWDYASLFQHPDPDHGVFRSPEEESLFRQALDGLGIFYSHAHTTVFKLTSHPPNYPNGYDLPKTANVAAYYDRGWPFTESCLASLTKDSLKTREFGYDSRISGASSSSFKCQDIQHRSAPLMPNVFADKLKACSFLNRFNDLPRLTKLYRQTFELAFQKVEFLRYEMQRWNDEQTIRVTDIIRHGFAPNLAILNLDHNSFGIDACRHLAAAILSKKSPLVNLDLSGNRRIGPERGIHVLADALVTLEYVGLQNLGMTNDCCQAITDAARERGGKSCRLVCLLLSKNEIDDSGCRALVELGTLAPLKHISLEENPASDAAKKPLENMSLHHHGHVSGHDWDLRGS